MKHIAWIFVGIVVGYLIGGIYPNHTLKKSYDEQQRLRDLLAQRPQAKKQGAYIPLISDNLDRSARPKNKTPSPKQKPPPTSTAKDDVITAPSEPPPPSPEEEQRREEQMERGIQTMLDTQRIRAEQSRVALIDQAGFDDEEIGAMDEIIDQLNSDLALYAEDMLYVMELQMSGDTPESQEVLGLTHKISGVLYESQQDMDTLVGNASVDEEAKSIFNHVDLEFLMEEAKREDVP
ncbi:MAG: hypothetical protein VX278_01595 [Myxococcota bacterium]|nr:hypothetical protein [Myxococcota bacterium]